MRPARAQRQADAHFAPAAEGAREHDAGDVGTGHEQQEAHGGSQHLGRGREVADEVFVQRPYERRHDPFLVLRLPDWRVGAVQIGLGLPGGDAGLQAAYRRSAVALVRLVRIAALRHPEPAAVRELRLHRQHADNRVDHLVEMDRLADDLHVAAEALAPQVVAEQDDGCALRRVVVGGEQASEHRLDTQHGRVFVGHFRALDALGAPVVGHVERGALVRRDPVEQPRVGAPAVKVGIGDARLVEVPARGGLVDVDELMRVVDLQRPEEEPVDQAEDRHVGGHAEREHRQGEAGAQLLARERADGGDEVDPGHEGLPAGEDGAGGSAAPREVGEPGGDYVGGRGEPGHECGEPPTAPRFVETLDEQPLHLGAMPEGQRWWRQAKETAIERRG